MKHVVVVGAGYAGILTAKKLAKRTKKREDVKITLIDRNPFHTMLTELHEVAAGRVDEDSIKISLKKVFARRKVDVVMDTVTGVDYKAKTVDGERGQYQYDYLVLATGSKPTFFGTPGAEEHSFTLWSYDDAVKLHGHILACFRKAMREADPVEKKRLLTFYVVGAGFTGVEMAGELAEYIPILCKEYEIDRSLVTLCEVDILQRTVPVLPEKLSDKVARRLAKMGVELKLNTGVVGIGEDYVELKKDDQVTRYNAATVIWTAGIEGSDVVSQSGGALETERRGRVKTDAHLRAFGHEDVFVTGDNLMYTVEGEDAPVPQMVENAEHSADTVAHNLTVLLAGEGELETYKPKFHGMMVCIGGRYGVARVGFPKLMFNLPSFLAMLSKHFINVIYFIQVLGWNKVFSYLKHEFFTIRHCRSFLGGHFSNRTPSFLLVPLRVWLGAVWLFEGIVKIMEGWFTTPMLAGFFGGANSWYNGILAKAGAPYVGGGTANTVATASAAVDAVTSATGTPGAVTAGSAIFDYKILGLFDAIFVTGSDATSTLNDYAFRLDVPLVNWFTNTLLLPNNGFQMFMQVSIVILEILIGLALIGGLFTTPAAAASLVLQSMFLCTTGLYLNTFWMIFAGIAMLFGAGYTLGLDYYAMPWLKKHWRRVPFARKWYLYHD